MRVKTLFLTNYRNYDSLLLREPGMLNVFIGKNAQGKTNLLESFYLLATGRSPRAARDADLIQWGKQQARVVADIERSISVLRVEIVLQPGVAKRVRVNGKPIRRLADLFGYLNVVMFTPDDLQLVKGSPSYRRQFLDYEIAQISPAYRDHLTRYNRILRQRNTILRAVAEGSGSKEALLAWENQFIEHGSRVIAKRAEMVAALSPLAGAIHATITQDKERLRLMYRPFFLEEGEQSSSEEWQDVGKVRERFLASLHRLRQAELRRGSTLVGPQRDDVVFRINDVDARLFGSQGQQRTAVLSCKLAEIAYMEEQVGEPPVLLLDDVMSELDASRRAFLVDVVQDRIQTFITSAHGGDLGDELLKAARVYHIEQGRMTPSASD